MEPACGVDQHHVHILGNRRFYAVIGDRGRVGAHLLLDDIDACAACPYIQLLDRSGTESVGRTEHNLLSLRLETGGQLAYRSGLAHTVHAHYHNHVWLVTEIEKRRWSGGPFVHQYPYLLAEKGQQFLLADIPVPGNPVLQLVYDFQRGIHAYVRGHESLLDGIHKVVINPVVADYRPGYPLEKSPLCLLYSFVKNSHCSLSGFNRANLHKKAHKKKWPGLTPDHFSDYIQDGLLLSEELLYLVSLDKFLLEAICSGLWRLVHTDALYHTLGAGLGAEGCDCFLCHFLSS